MERTYHYSVVQRLIEWVENHYNKHSQLTLVIGLQGAFGAKEQYTKAEANNFVKWTLKQSDNESIQS